MNHLSTPTHMGNWEIELCRASIWKQCVFWGGVEGGGQKSICHIISMSQRGKIHLGSNLIVQLVIGEN